MKKPKLPKKWKGLKWNDQPLCGGIRLYTRRDGTIRAAVLMLDGGELSQVQCDKKIPLSRLVRAVELAAIHAGLVEDRDR
jgi:hypothetical protein